MKRTRLIDDSCDWFDMEENPWLTPEERAEAARQARKIRIEEEKADRQVFVDLDFSVGLVDSTHRVASRRERQNRTELQEFLHKTHEKQ